MDYDACGERYIQKKVGDDPISHFPVNRYDPFAASTAAEAGAAASSSHNDLSTQPLRGVSCILTTSLDWCPVLFTSEQRPIKILGGGGVSGVVSGSGLKKLA